MRTLTPDERKDVIAQIQYLHNEAIGVQSAFLGSIALPVGVFALILYYALSLEPDEQAVLFIMLPFLFSLSTFNLLKYTIKILGLDAYIRHLEILLNESYQKPLFLWQSHLVYVNGYSPVGGLVQIPAFVALLIFFVYKFFHHLPSCTWFPYAAEIFRVLLVVQGIALFIATLCCLSQYQAVLAACQEIDRGWDEGSISGFKDGFPAPSAFSLVKPYALKKLSKRPNDHHRKSQDNSSGEPSAPSGQFADDDQK